VESRHHLGCAYMKIVFAVITGLFLSVGMSVTIDPIDSREICGLQGIRVDQLDDLAWLTLEQVYFEHGGILP